MSTVNIRTITKNLGKTALESAIRVLYLQEFWFYSHNTHAAFTDMAIVCHTKYKQLWIVLYQQPEGLIVCLD